MISSSIPHSVPVSPAYTRVNAQNLRTDDSEVCPIKYPITTLHMTLHASMLPSNLFRNDKNNVFDLMTPLPPKPRKKRSAEPEKPIEEYEEYVALVLHEGRIMLKASPALKQFKNLVLEPEAKGKFGHIVTDFIAPDRRPKPRKSSNNSLGRQQDGQLLPYARKTPKRRHQTILDEFSPQPFFLNGVQSDGQEASRGNRKMALPITDSEAHQKWFADAFRAVQQVGCRTIAKVWIKKIHPKKQSTHPYNGSLPRELSPDANRTKPPYWPDEVKHKEPDHIDRASRTQLLVHLINNTPQRQIKVSREPDVYIYAQDLLAALEEKKDDFKDDRWAIIQEIIAVRQQLEAFAGDYEYCDPSATIPVTDFAESSRSKSGVDADEDDDIKAEADDDGGAATTSPSGHGTSAPSPEDPLHHIAQYSSRLGQDVRPSVADGDQIESVVGPEVFAAETEEDRSHIAASHKRFAAQLGPTAELTSMSSVLTHPSVSVHTDIYGLKSSVGFGQRGSRSNLRQPLGRMRHPSHHPPPDMVMMPGWVTNNLPTDFLPVEYTFNGAQCHTPIPPQALHMAETAIPGMTDSPMEMMSASMMDSMPYHAFASGRTRPMPTRTMSSSEANVADQSMPGPPQDMYFQG